MALDHYQQQFIDFLVVSGALKFGDFTLKSGRKCPYFLNLGQFYTSQQLITLSSAYAAAMRQQIEEFTIVFGPAYKGIPLCVAVTMALYQQFGLGKAYTFNRKEAKDHGEGGMLVGAPLDQSSKVVIVDDVMTAGTALREAIELLKKNGNPEIVGVMIAVDRMEKGRGDKSATQELKEEYGIPVYSIVTIDQIVEYLRGREWNGEMLLNPERMAAIEAYRKEYGVKSS